MIRAMTLRLCLAGAFALSMVAHSAMAITGAWSGQLQDSNGGEESVTYRFSPAGNPILRFQTRQGYRDMELQAVGQRHEWLLRGQGWARGTVEALSVGPDRVQVIVSIYTESGGGSLLDQSTRRLGLDFVQSGNAVHATVVHDAKSYSSGAGLGLYAGRRAARIQRGTLYPNR